MRKRDQSCWPVKYLSLRFLLPLHRGKTVESDRNDGNTIYVGRHWRGRHRRRMVRLSPNFNERRTDIVAPRSKKTLGSDFGRRRNNNAMTVDVGVAFSIVFCISVHC